MNRWRVSRGWIIVWLGCALSVPLGWTAEAPESSASLYISPRTVQGWLAQGQRVVFLDVRESDEFAAGHLPGAINISHDRVTSIMDRLDRTAPLVLYCIHSAHRAPEAAKVLRQHGFANAVVLEGGIVAWHAGGAMILASHPSQPPTILPLTERCAQKAAPHS